MQFVFVCLYTARSHKKQQKIKGKKDGTMVRAIHAKNTCGNYSALGIALLMYLWVQNIHPIFAIIYGGALFLGCWFYVYSVLCYEVRHGDKYFYRLLGGGLALAAIFATALTGLIALF